MSGRCDDDEDDLTVAYLWGKAEARDDIRKLQEESDRLEAMVDKMAGSLVDKDAEIKRLREALQQGVAMRAAQRAYFADRSRENLIASKEAEKAFDVAARTALGEDK